MAYYKPGKMVSKIKLLNLIAGKKESNDLSREEIDKLVEIQKSEIDEALKKQVEIRKKDFLESVKEYYDTYDYETLIKGAINQFLSKLTYYIDFEIFEQKNKFHAHSSVSFPDLFYMPTSIVSENIFYPRELEDAADIERVYPYARYGYIYNVHESVKRIFAIDLNGKKREDIFVNVDPELYAIKNNAENVFKVNFCRMIKGLPFDIEAKYDDLNNWLTRRDLIDLLNRVDDNYYYSLAEESDRYTINQHKKRLLYHKDYDKHTNLNFFKIRNNIGSDVTEIYESSNDYINVDPRKEYQKEICNYIIAIKKRA